MILDDMLLHFGVGVTFAIGDRILSKNSKRYTEKRIEDKTRQVAALDYIRGVQSNPDNKEAVKSRDYLEAILVARSYFKDAGVSAGNYSQGFQGFMERVSDKVKSLKILNGNEKINPRLSKKAFGENLKKAYLIELAADGLYAGTMLAAGAGGNILTAFTSTTWQGAGFFVGLEAGKLGVWLFTRRSKEEKAFDEMAREITSDGKLLDIVRNYSATAAVEVPKTPETEGQTAEGKAGDYATELGRKAGEHASAIAGKVSGGVKLGFNAVLSEVRRLAEQRAAAANATKEAQEKQKAEWRAKYDKY